MTACGMRSASPAPGSIAPEDREPPTANRVSPGGVAGSEPSLVQCRHEVALRPVGGPEALQIGGELRLLPDAGLE